MFFKLNKSHCPNIFWLYLLMMTNNQIYAQSNSLKKNGIEVYKKNQTQPGFNLINGCIILDMYGNRVKEYPGVLCGYFNSGEIISSIDGQILSLFNMDLSPKWNKSITDNIMGIHHEISITSDSSFIFLSSDIKEKKNYRNFPLCASKFQNTDFGVNKIRYDVIYHMNTNGTNLLTWSTCDHFNELITIIEKNRHESYLDTFKWFVPEFTHFNSLQILPSNPYEKEYKQFSKGNILFSDIAHKFIGIIDKDSLKVVWTFFQSTNGNGQHSARMLPNGNILYFLNQSGLPENPSIKFSKVVELNPVTHNIEWEYVADPPQSFYSEFDGNAQRLPNGNTLITVNNINLLGLQLNPDKYPNHYAFEVTPDKEVVWKWIPNKIEDFNKTTEGFYRVERIDYKTIAQFIQSTIKK